MRFRNLQIKKSLATFFCFNYYYFFLIDQHKQIQTKASIQKQKIIKSKIQKTIKKIHGGVLEGGEGN
jgi:hypothetical protein